MKQFLNLLSAALTYVSVFCIVFVLTLADAGEVRTYATIAFTSGVFALAIAIYNKE